MHTVWGSSVREKYVNKSYGILVSYRQYYHKFSDVKQHAFILLQFWKSEI